MDNANNFASNHYVRSSWIAFFTLWVIWGFVYFIRHVFSSTADTSKPAPAREDPETAEQAGTTKESRWVNSHYTVHERFDRTHRVLFENSLLLLSVLTLNTFGYGATRAVMILAWIFFAFTIVNAFTEVAVKHNFISFFFNIVLYGVSLAIGGLAFRQGWA